MPTHLDAAALRRAVRHPAVWCLPLMALLVWVALPLNEDFYLRWVNYDPQGSEEQEDWVLMTRVFRYTSGLLWGQLLALVAGAVLSRRHRQAVALVIAVPLGALLAAVAVAVAYPAAQLGQTGRYAVSPFAGPELLPVLLRELAAFPLYAAAGVGLGLLIRGRHRLVPVLLLLGWCVATVTGLLQTDTYDAWPWLLWTVPPVAAGAAVALAGTAISEATGPALLLGDAGRGPALALLVGAAAWAVLLNAVALRWAVRTKRS